MDQKSSFETQKQETKEVVKKVRRGKRWVDESKITWHIAGPAILTAVAQFSFAFVTAAYCGHLGDVELAAVTEVQGVIEGFAFGAMLGMGSALETLCGQAVGAGQFSMLGVYLQRSWIICCVTALFLSPLYIFTAPILKGLHQDKEVSEHAGKYAIYVIPQLFAYALNFPMQKFLQSQSKVWVMTIISLVALALHVLFNWIFVTKLELGLLGAAIAGNISWLLLVGALMLYIVAFGYFPESWSGFSTLAFKSLISFVKLSLSSAIMLCLELWYPTAILLMVGGLKNSTNAVDVISVCMNVQLWTLMIAIGFNASVSVRVSNELGAGEPKDAKFAVVVNTLTSAVIGLVFAVLVISSRFHFPKMFTDKPRVIRDTSKLSYILAGTIFLNSVQPVLHGVAVGAGWQFQVALVNIGSYYIFGLPFAGLLGYKFNLRVWGIWSAMLGGTVLQTIILLFIVFRTNWRKEALQAEERVRTWGGQVVSEQSL
ncbi:transporter [Lithospermum erythrorhizon]|uniref:Protein DETOXIFICATION n=1 Tax=Lithospermum erythrorhizon TaxID=34254 RepID=A0AAV3RK81_LITER